MLDGRGFSLIELMISLLLSLLLVLAAAQLHMSLLRHDMRWLQRVQLLQTAESIIAMLEQDLRGGGFRAGASTLAGDVFYASATCLLTGRDMDRDGVIAGPQEWRGYRYVAARGQLLVQGWHSVSNPARLCAQDLGWQPLLAEEWQVQEVSWQQERMDRPRRWRISLRLAIRGANVPSITLQRWVARRNA